ncbi:unnamed protein product [Lactuca saligna]|uniref:Uncharacterized protein n=1 Tax=Lactuca saligna TaxID=75948 RepID=A0AA35YA36_LACSI|nr:unnamed protein product [Lactuca saligna]
MMNTEEEEHLESAELEFDPEEEDIEDHAIMSGKQYTILNSNLNIVLQCLIDSSTFSNSHFSKDDVEFLLKSQKTNMKTLITNEVTQLQTRLTDNMTYYTFGITKVQNVARERHVIFGKMLTSSKESILLKIKDLVNMVTEEITKLDKFCLRLQQNVDVLLGATRTLIKDICAFNKGYAVELKLKKESEGNMITRNLVLRLPTNAPHPLMFVSQARDKGGSSKYGCEDNGKVAGKVFTTQIPIPISVKPILTASTTTPKIEVELRSKKGLNINEGGSGSSTFKLVATLEPKGKGKDVHVEPFEEKKKILQ